MPEDLKHIKIGQIQIADEVIAVIAGTAALEVEGVVATTGKLTGDLVEMLGKKSLSKGVKITINEGQATIDITIIVKFGFKIHEVSKNVQMKVKNAVETMTGLTVTEANIFVTGVLQEAKAKPEKQ